jgi:electron transfer flavoprotein beta subunit
MKIVVCLKQVLDPEAPARDFRIDPEKREAERGAASLVTSIFCANALETALQFRDRHGGTITAISYGPPSAEEVLRKAFALKADEAVHVVQDVGRPTHPWHVARVLAAAIRKLGGADLVLTGRESADWGYGQTGGLLAEELRLPCLAFVDRIRLENGDLIVGRQTDAGRDVYSAKPPLVLTITNDDHNVPRVPKTKDVMLSSRKTIARWTPLDLGVDDGDDAYVDVVDLFVPEKSTACEFVEGDDLDQKIETFARRICETMAQS